MSKQSIKLLAVIVIATALTTGCESTKAATPTTTSSPPSTSTPPAVTTQTTTSVMPTTSVTPSTAATTTTSTTTTTQPNPSSTTPPPTITTSAAPTTKGPYIIRGQLNGVDDVYATVKVGTTVRWTPVGHAESVAIIVSEVPGLFGGPVDPYYEYTFNEAGTFWYGIKGLAYFRGSVTVTP